MRRLTSTKNANHSIESGRDFLGVMLGLLLGFRLPMALSHFEQRNQLVIAEANAIATAIQRAQMLPEPFRGNLLQLLQEYVHTRIEFGKDLDESGLQASISDTNRLQNEMWQQSVMLVKQNPNMVTPLFVQALGTSAELSDQRLVAQGTRIP